MVYAVVLGTALSALGPGVASALTPDAQAVNAIGRYCTACWRNARLPADYWQDCTQEVFTRLLQTLPAAQWNQALRAEGDERRELVRAIDAIKKRTQRRRHYAPLGADVSERPVSEWRDHREELDRASATVLSDRQRRVIELTRDGWSIPEIADELRTTPERISDEKYKAIRKLRQHFGVENDRRSA